MSEGLFSTNWLCRECHAHRDGIGQHTGKTQQRARSSEQTHADLGNAELGSLGRDDEITREGNLHATGQRETFNSCDHRLLRRSLGDPGKASVGGVGEFACGKIFEVHPGAETATVAGKNATRDVRVGIHFFHGSREFLSELLVHGVHGVGTVQGHDLDLAPHFTQNYCFF